MSQRLKLQQLLRPCITLALGSRLRQYFGIRNEKSSSSSSSSSTFSSSYAESS
ncbi:hypothetical protein DPMN_046307 [Dreissena polymorpha]|uniref:Uncharacterized protein n=1 Tax=Dreissena polymorpha TaxID=45954 RepID=A0A9D4D9D9_DREPO|nr:hypothetical protein DPMN_046307 [Dreissena polymorpha]